MRSVLIAAHGLRVLFSGLRRMGVTPAAAMTPGVVRSSAYGLGYGIMAMLWLKRKQAPSWGDIDAAWEQRLPPAGTVEEALYGRLDPADRIELLTSNRHAFEIRDRLFADARQSIDIATYYVQTDVTSWQVTRQLIECAKRGVQVRVLADGVATAQKTFERFEVGHVASVLRDAGVTFSTFRDGARPFDANHRKMIVVDRDTFITGGRNFADHYSGDEWRDSDILMTGPSVAEAQAVFDETFRNAEGHPEDKHDRGPSIYQSTTPAGIQNNHFFRYLVQCIRAARNTIDIENAYYFHHPILDRHLAAARERGVRVRIFTNSEESNDLDFANYRIYSGFPRLLDLGVELYLRRGKHCTLHCKYWVVDGEWVSYGSSNLDYYSPRFCSELGLHIRDAGFGAELTRWFEQGIAEADRVTNREAVEEVIRKQTVGRVFDRWLTDIQ
ncbi:MAG: phosphatidylserine/phosphatidylglycerophosphate/cardiolipin synthase family protein [Bryobacteraceae bacterium]